MDIQSLSLDMMSNGVTPYKTFEGLRDLFDEYNRLDSEVDEIHLMLKEIVDQYNNYETLIDVQEKREPVSDMTVEALKNQQEVIVEQLGFAQEAINESLIKMSLLETMIGYVINTNEEDAEDIELDASYGWDDDSDFDDEDDSEDDDEDSEDEEDSEEVYLYSVEDEGVILYTLEFNPEMPEHLKVSMSEFIKSCTQMFVEMLIEKAGIEETEEVVEEETPVQDPNAVVFGADFGKIIGELSVSSPAPAIVEDEDLEDDEEDYDPLANLALNADGTLQENEEDEDYNNDDDFPREFQGN